MKYRILDVAGWFIIGPSADVILYDKLINSELLDYAKEGAELIYVGKNAGAHCVDQTAIEALLIKKARQGSTVVRLKGGDPFVFGRGGEETQALRAAGIAFEVVPGVSSALAAPAFAGIPVTHRSCASSVAIVTGHSAARNHVKWGELSRAVDTLVILMGLSKIRAIMNQLQAKGCPSERPAALIQSGTPPTQKIVVGTVASLTELSERGGFASPSVIVVGEAVNFADNPARFLHPSPNDMPIIADQRWAKSAKPAQKVSMSDETSGMVPSSFADHK